MAWDALTDKVNGHHQHLDQRISSTLSALQAKGTSIYCREGCGNCCSLAVNCSFPEACQIANTLTPAQQSLLNQSVLRLLAISQQAEDLKQFLKLFRSEIGCAFLDPATQSCTIYESRPLSCRALLSTRPPGWCGVDFSTLHELEKQAFLSSLDPELVNYPTHYLAAPQEVATELESDLTLSMYESLGVGLSGSLLYLVWLERKEKLSSLLRDEPDRAKALIDRVQTKHPWLLQIR